ncbi:MAG: hypothetical protein K5705_04795 [Oscillospiraceae bacterium]|nr:hypothetical protein [Oscillospiraceae bacterium]
MQKYPKEEKMLRQILNWERKHLRSRTKVNYALTVDLLKNNGLDSDFRKYIVTKEYSYVSDTSRVFDLGHYGETVKSWLTEACSLIDIFHERHALRGKMEKHLREDGLYEQMERLFYSLMSGFLHTISFFQYDRIMQESYRNAGICLIRRTLGQAQKLLDYYGSYLSLQGSASLADPSDEVGNIQLAVESMQEALQQARSSTDSKE